MEYLGYAKDAYNDNTKWLLRYIWTGKKQGLSSFSPEFHEFRFFIRCTVMMALGTCFWWVLCEPSTKGSALQSKVEPQTMKAAGTVGAAEPALASGPADWTNVGSCDVRNCWIWQITMTEPDRSHPQHHEEWLSFTGGLRGSDVRDGQTSLKRSFGTLVQTNSSLIPTSAGGYKTEINCDTNGLRNTDWAMDVVKIEPIVKK